MGKEAFYYAKIDLDLLDHPKAAQVGLAAVGAYVLSILYCKRHKTDGRIVKNLCMSLCGGEGQLVFKKLTDPKIGWWFDRGDYVEVFNYTAKNGTAAEHEERKKSNREAQARWRDKHGPKPAAVPLDAILAPLPSNDSHNALTKALVSSSSSSSLSSLIPEGEPERETLAPPFVLATPREQEYQAAYERGISAGKGSPFALPENQRGALHQAILGHGRDPDTTQPYRGPKLIAWLAHDAEQFARWLTARPTELKFYSGYGPRGFLRWLNETPVETTQGGLDDYGPQGRTESSPMGRLGAGIGHGGGGS